MSNELPTRKQLISQIINLRNRLALLGEETKKKDKELIRLRERTKLLEARVRHANIELGKWNHKNGSGNKHRRLSPEEWNEIRKLRGWLDDDD